MTKCVIGAVLPLLLLAVSPPSLHAQHAQLSAFAEPSATPITLRSVQDPQEMDSPEDQMSMSGMFLGIVGMLGGAAIGSAVAQGECKNGPEGCIGRHAFTGALIAGSFMVPLGVHLANKEPRRFIQSLAVSALAGAAFYYSLRAIPGAPIQIAPFLAAPVQMVTSIKIETKD